MKTTTTYRAETIFDLQTHTQSELLSGMHKVTVIQESGSRDEISVKILASILELVEQYQSTGQALDALHEGLGK